MSEQYPQQPTPLNEILDNHLDDVLAFEGDTQRQEQVHIADLRDEQATIEAEINDLWGEIQAGRADEGARERLDDLKRALVATDADMFEIRRSQDVNPSQ